MSGVNRVWDRWRNLKWNTLKWYQAIAMGTIQHPNMVSKPFQDRFGVDLSPKNCIVAYHGVGEPTNEGFYGRISIEQFEADIAYLSHTFDVVSLDDVFLGDTSGRIAITFDDGLRSVHSEVLPVLRRFDVHATVFLNPGFLNNRQPKTIVERHGIRSDDRIMLSDAEVLVLVEEPLVSIGNHTRTHRNLGAIDDATELHEEVLGGKRLIEDRYGAVVEAFSYPYGASSDEARRIVEETHTISVTTEPSLLEPPASGHRLPRLEAHHSSMKLCWQLLRYGSTVDGFRESNPG